ncbi:MAG: glycosyltransferase [Fibrobacteria bacterium]
MSSRSASGKRRIVVYDDAYAFGGHELMVCRLLRGLAQDPETETLALFSEANLARMTEQGLGGPVHGNLRVEYLPFANPRRLGNLAALLSPAKVAQVLLRLRRFRPDVVLAAQGGIDTSMIGLLAARLGGYRAISYIPNLNGYARNQPTVKNRLRDRLNRPFHRVPHEFAVIRQGHVDELRALGFRGRTHVIYNAVDTDKLVRIPKAEARAALGIPAEAYALGLIGRIDIVNKGHLLAAMALKSHAEAFRGACLVVAGEGPEEAALRDFLRAEDLEHRVHFLGFRKDLSALYSALDLVIIPSLSEGVPLVMIEALHYGLPVAASAVDGMLEMLPPAWLFPAGDAAALADRVAAIRSGSALWKGREALLARFDAARFARDFRSLLS